MHRAQEGEVLQGACLGGSVQRIRAQCIVLLHGSFARALRVPHEAAACFPAQMNESAHALRWRAPAHCARRLRRVRCSFSQNAARVESKCVFLCLLSVWTVCGAVCVRNLVRIRGWNPRTHRRPRHTQTHSHITRQSASAQNGNAQRRKRSSHVSCSAQRTPARRGPGRGQGQAGAPCC